MKKLGDNFNNILEVSKIQTRPVPTECALMTKEAEQNSSAFCWDDNLNWPPRWPMTSKRLSYELCVLLVHGFNEG